MSPNHPPSITNQSYLRQQQYKTADNLKARIELHRRFGTNPGSWFEWVFDHIDPQPGERLLEAGCGPGALWAANRQRLPDGVQLFLGDLSTGMAQEARRALMGVPGLHFLALDLQNAPLNTFTFDRIVANHMLYHLPDIGRGVAELARLLKPRGRLFTATNGVQHMLELHQLLAEFDPQYDSPLGEARRFTLENAADILGASFAHIEVHEFKDDLIITEVEPLLAYIFSMWNVLSVQAQGRQAELEAFVRSQFDQQGKMFIHKSQGIAIAY